ncbi:MAG TPA: hypothetical protein VF631_07500 [Allosphingosinicella sp.]|jgi:hypothetical protein|uniref:hypothetical protein n=1 Tax=Allosphingosinicella sp. TaxID=2823234 RepID=UPI002F285C1D
MEKLKIIKATKAYQVSYRIKGETTAKGKSQERYDDLVGRLERFKAVLRSRHFDDEAHTATSSWIIRSSEPTAEALARKLGRNLTPGVDLLEVIEVVPTNWYQLTR